MKKNSFVITAVLYGVAAGALAHAQAAAAAPPAAAAAAAPAAIPTRIAVIDFGGAMQRTKEGQKATADINTKFGPKKAEFDKRQADIDALTDKLNKGRAIMTEDAQKTLAADIQKKTTEVKRFGEDSEAELQNDEAKMTNELQQKMAPIIAKYAIENGFAAVLDVGQQSPVLWYATATNISDAIVALYDQVHPVAEAPAAAKPTAPTAPSKPPGKK